MEKKLYNKSLGRNLHPGWDTLQEEATNGQALHIYEESKRVGEVQVNPRNKTVDILANGTYIQ